MKKMIIIVAFALATFAVPSMAAPKKDRQDKKAKQERVEDKQDKRQRGWEQRNDNRGASQRDQEHSMRDPRKRSAMMADKLNFTTEQRARLASLNSRYSGDDIDRRAYHEEFKAILNDSQRQQAEEWKKQRGGKGKGNRQNRPRD